ncbi:MAG: FtsW/RodA/SpoVE family cell cycle protein, partial [Clostridia bacterium]|nr:FtsW/RodA/SpoVE family cell cycle protein [Clostridia bacterium]
LLKIVFIVTFATHLNKVKERINKLRVLFPLCLHGALPVLICHRQGDDGMALIFLLMFAAMLAAAGLKLRYFIIAFILIVASLPLIYFFIMNDTQRARVTSMLDIEADLLGSGWQQWRARIAMANGSLFGQGILRGQLVQAGSIPEGYNDLIFVSIGEEFGFIGCLAVMALLFAICVRVIIVAHRANDSLGCYICIGFFAMIAAQTVINLGMCLSLLPVVGITLPFFSYGGSSLACLLLGLGLVASVHTHRTTREIHIKTDF